MRILIIFLIVLGFAAPAAAADSPAWTTANSRLVFTRARVSFPLQFATLTLSETKELGAKGEGMDSVALYRSGDQEVLASIYVYFPALAHSGLTAIATDQAIRHASQDRATARGAGLTAAAGRPGIAIRADYGNYLGQFESRAAFIKAGRWIVKIRISGPPGRKAEIDSALAALLEQMRFDPGADLRPASILETPDCPPGRAGDDARLRPDNSAEIMEDTIIFGPLDATGEPAKPGKREQDPSRSRIGDHWCRRWLDAGQSRITLLRATGIAAGSPAEEGKSLLFVLYSDAGGMLEVARTPETRRYVLLQHQIGSTSVLGSFDSMPSDRQLVDVLAGRGDAGRHRADVRFKASGDADVTIITPATTPVPTT